MRSYVITIRDIQKSVDAAYRCIFSMPEYDVRMFDAFTPADKPLEFFEENKLNYNGFKQQKGREYSYEEAAMSAFISHWSLWKRCAERNEEIQIFEHDAVCVGILPKFIPYKGCVSLGQPSYGRFNTPPIAGVNPLVSKRYFPGAHAYRLKPETARVLLEAAQEHAQPTDIFLNLDLFPWLEEYYPWPVIAKDSFTTIQRELGCRAKHNFNEDYEIIKHA